MTKRAREGRMKGEQRHAEGDHGPVTRSRIAEEAHQAAPDNDDARSGAAADGSRPADGGDARAGRREQHDPAEEKRAGSGH